MYYAADGCFCLVFDLVIIFDRLKITCIYDVDAHLFVSVESFSGMFQSSSPLLRKSEPPVQVQDTIITAWTIRHPTRNRNDPIARAELYQLSYIPPSQVEHA